MELNFNINLTKSQRKAYNIYKQKDTRFLLLRWSRQSGKSIFAEIILIENLCKRKKFSAYISPTYSQGRKLYKELCNLLDGTGIIRKANSSTLTIESIFGSTLQFFSIESPTSIRGNTVSGVLVVDEMAFFPDALTDGSDPWASVIFPITKAHKPKCILISTPKGKRGCFYTLYLRAKAKQKGWKELSANIYDDSLLSEEDIKEIKDQMPEIAFKEEFLCEFLDSSLSYFTGFENCFDLDDKPSYHKCWIGIDLSANGKDETIVTFINEKNDVGQQVIKGTLDEKYATIADILDNTPNLQSVLIESNGIGEPMINEIKKATKKRKRLINEFVTTNESKNKILSELALKISKKDIHFLKDDNQLFAQFGCFIIKWTKTGKVQLMAMDGKHDDRIMSLAIALKCKESSLVPKKALSVVSV